ncbi:hypothetical protein F5888DRAFT_1946627, partial [Russula emetica]
MMDTIIQIMVEVLTILGIATKGMRQGRIKKYGMRLIGRTDMEDALKRLDKLTHEEARMAIAENLRATHAVDDRVAGVDDRLANVNDKVTEVIHDGKEARQVMEQTANDVDQVKQNQLRDSIYKWLSPPDPSTNHNIACDTHHKKAATWFFEGNIYQEWKSKGSLLWIHGKPGSGKSILCSTIIQDIKTLCEASQASMGYFYFDFRNANKQGLHDLLPSLLTQISARSTARCDILSKLYSDHDDGKMQPSDSVLTKCLKDMLTLPGQHPTYLIMDALDESSGTSGIPSPRERVLQLVRELVDLRQQNLHICVTSRPEIDIKDVLEPLTSRRVSLHDQTGQKKDIADYVRSVVYSNVEPIIRRWKKEDKDTVIETLSERADGMFRWVYCQLEILRHCLPSSVQRFLEELPESLDETYERVLREIKKPNRDHARRILQCLVVAIRPLRVEELAEVLAVDFDDVGGIPKLKPGWRWEDEEQALFTSCSSLIAIVDTGDSRVVQFSHFSVKEYLTSTRLATSSQDVSRYHIAHKPAHTILAQACVSVLLQLGDHDEPDDVEKNGPLARYAAEYWVRHAQFEDVVSCIKGMEYLFDLDKSYFAAWRRLYDIDIKPPYEAVFFQLNPQLKSRASTSLYYAALCGFANLVEQLIVKYPQHVNAIGGYYVTPAVAALAGRYFQLAQVLHRNGSSVEPQGSYENTPLHSAVYYGDLEMVQVLLEYGVDVEAQNIYCRTPLSFAPSGDHDDPRVARLLIERGADPNTRDWNGVTPLHRASQSGRIEVVRLLIEHGAN